MNVVLGIVLKIASTFAFTAMGTIIKLVGSNYPTGQVVFFRSFFALAPLIVWLAWRRELADALRTRNPLGHLRRSLAGSAAMFSGFAALAMLPLPDATAIGYATPLMTTALAALVLKEKVRRYRWSALGVGFCGMLVMMSPYIGGAPATSHGPQGSAIGAMLAVLGTMFSALASVQIRMLAQTEKTAAIVFYFSATAALLATLTALLGWPMPSLHDGLFLAAAGFLGGVGQILMTSSYRFAPVSVIAPFDYTSLVWALIAGFVVFGDAPQAMVLAGAALVVAAGLFVIYRERQLGIARREREAGSERPA